jgi:hypothetical protein
MTKVKQNVGIEKESKPKYVSTIFLIRIVGGGGGGVQIGPTRHVGHFWPIVPAPSDCEDGEFGKDYVN